MYKTRGTQSHQSLIPKASGHCTGPRRTELALLFLSLSKCGIAFRNSSAFRLLNAPWATQHCGITPMGTWLQSRVLEPVVRAMKGSTEAMSLCRPAVRDTEQRQPLVPGPAAPGTAGGAPGPDSGSSRRERGRRGTPSQRLLTRLRLAVSYGMRLTLMCKLDLDVRKVRLGWDLILFIFAVISGKQKVFNYFFFSIRGK